MESSEKVRFGPKRACLVGAALGFFCVLALVGFLFWFLKSPHFLELLHSVLARRFQSDVRIGSVKLQDGSILVIRDLKIGRESEDPAVRLALPYAAVGLSFEGLRQGRVDSLTLRNPKLFLRPEKATERPPGGAGLSLPLNLGRLAIEDGEVVVQLAERTLSGGFSFHAQTDRKNTAEFVFSGGMETVVLLSSRAPETSQTGTSGAKLVRSIGVQGTLTSLAPNRVAVEAQVRTDGLALGMLQKDLLVPLGVGRADMSVVGTLGGNTTLTGTSPGVLQWDSEIVVHGLALSSAQGGVDLDGAPLRLSVRGAYHEEADRLHCELFEARVGDHPPWSLHGEVTDLASKNPGFDLQLETSGFPLSFLKERIVGSGLDWLHALEMTGQASMGVALTGRAESPRLAGKLHLAGERFESTGVLLEPFEMELPFVCGTAKCLVREAWVHGKTVRLDFANGRGVRHQLLNAHLRVPQLQFVPGALRVSDAEFQADQIAIGRGRKLSVSERGVSLLGDLEMDLQENRVTLANYRLRSDTLGQITGDIDCQLGETVTVQASARHRGVNLKNLRERFAKNVSPLRDYSLEGTAAVQGAWTMRIPRQGVTGVQGELDMTLRDGSVASLDGTRVAAGIRAQGSGRFDFSVPMKRAAFNLETRVSHLEMLWGPFYGDFSQRPFSLKAEGIYHPEADRLDLSHLSAGLTTLGRLLVSGSLWNVRSNPVFDARLRLEELSNGNAYDFFVRETFQESFPLLGTLTLNGRTDVDLTVRGTRQRLGVQGEIRVTDMNLHGEAAGIGLAGFQLRLPVDISPDETGAVNMPQRTGSLRFSNLAWKALQTGPVELFPALQQDVLAFRGDVALPLFGGRAVFKEIAYRDLFNPERRLGLSVDIQEFDLSKMSVALGLPPFQGILSGTIPTVTFAGRQLRTTGAIVLTLFGGEVTIEGISINNVFSPVASMEATVALREIDLGRLTDTFEFGHISGILQGYVRDLVISNGQPESFRVHLETIERKGVPQRISVEALEKISILGSGASPSIFGRGVYRLFKEYRYAKLGFSGRLRNDNFTLRGIVREGDLEYLVRGGVLPPKVNVINYTQEISFREMVKRLKRVQLAGEAETRPRE